MESGGTENLSHFLHPSPYGSNAHTNPSSRHMQCQLPLFIFNDVSGIPSGRWTAAHKLMRSTRSGMWSQLFWCTTHKSSSWTPLWEHDDCKPLHSSRDNSLGEKECVTADKHFFLRFEANHTVDIHTHMHIQTKSSPCGNYSSILWNNLHTLHKNLKSHNVLEMPHVSFMSIRGLFCVVSLFQGNLCLGQEGDKVFVLVRQESCAGKQRRCPPVHALLSRKKSNTEATWTGRETTGEKLSWLRQEIPQQEVLEVLKMEQSSPGMVSAPVGSSCSTVIGATTAGSGVSPNC